MTATEEIGIAGRVIIRLLSFIYIGAFALGGYLLWLPFWEKMVEPYAQPESQAPVDQMVHGAVDAMLLLGPVAGLLAATFTIAVIIGYQRGDPDAHE